MAVSKRTRFEVLRRDDYSCRYCHSKDNPLTIDHVVPVALGGTDDPSNLVAACRDCNAGKSSATPDAALVAQVNEDAVRWAAAMKQASEMAAAKRSTTQAELTHFREHVWESWTYGKEARTVPLPTDWGSAVMRLLDSGLTMVDLEEAVHATMTHSWLRTDEFRYFMGVTRNMLLDRTEAARQIVENANAS